MSSPTLTTAALTWANIRAHKRRLIGLALAVLLGTAFLSGTLILSDTLRGNIDALIGRAGAGTDVVVRNATAVSTQPGVQRGDIDAGVLPRVASVPGVADAQPVISGYGEIEGGNGAALTPKGPRQAQNWIGDPALTPWRIVAGHAPTADGQVVIDQHSAEAGALALGGQTTVLTPAPVHVTVVGIATFGGATSDGGESYAAFTLDDARRWLTPDPGRISGVSVRAAAGVSQQQLAARIRAVLPPGVEADTGAQATAEQQAAVDDGFLAFFGDFLDVFAAIALLVAALSINHTFSVVIAQRTREAALLRALGAERRQVLRGVLAEAAAVGVVASAAGLAAGLGLADALKGAFKATGFDLPAAGLIVHASTAAIVLPVGIAVTVLAALVPAVRGSRVAPVVALRDSAAETPDIPRRRTLAGTLLLAAGIALAVTGAEAASTTLVALAAPATLLGLLLAAPVGVRLLGRAVTAPLPRLRGAAGALARGNLLRNPRRSAGAATAMLVGIAVVALLSVVASSLKAGTGQALRQVVGGQVVVSGTSSFAFQGTGFDPSLTRQVAALPEVETAAGLQKGTALLAGRSEQVTPADTARLDHVLRLGVTAGTVDALGPGAVAVSDAAASAHGWSLGSAVPVTYPDGDRATLTVAGIYTRTAIVGDYVLDRATWGPHAVSDLDATTVVALRPGASTAAAQTDITRLAAPYGAPPVQDVDAFVAAQTQGLGSLLAIVYVMLALAVLIALAGIANTLSLAAHERTRELGLLRAVGAGRGQLRAALRWESGLIALLGTLAGLGLGLFLGWALVEGLASSEMTFSVPTTQVLVLLVVGAVGGLVAGIRPAARATRMNVLRALSSE